MCKKGNLPNTCESEFYITIAPIKEFNCNQIAFGRVVEGMNVIHEIAEIPTQYY